MKKPKDILTGATYQHPYLGYVKFDDIKDPALWRQIFILEYDRTKSELKTLRSQRNKVIDFLGGNDE